MPHLFILLLFLTAFSPLSAVSIDGRTTPAYREGRDTFNNGDYARGLVVFKNGIIAAANASIIFDIPGGILNGNIISANASFPATLCLEGDLTLGSTGWFKGPFNIKGFGNTLTLTGSCDVLANANDSANLNVTRNLIIDGRGNTMHFKPGAYISVDPSVTLTLRNLIITHDPSGPAADHLIVPSASTSSIALDTVVMNLKNDWRINSGRWFIHNDVLVTGTSKLSYKTTGSMRITSGASLMFDLNTTFSYDPPIALGKQLLSMADRTSQLLLNGATLCTTHTGLQLTRGTLVIDNVVTLSNVGGRALSQAIIFGDGTAANDLSIAVYPGGSLALNSGVLDYRNTV